MGMMGPSAIATKYVANKNYHDGDATSVVPAPLTFTALAGPFPLFPGEITNTFHHLRIPKGPIAISEFSADIVEKDPFSISTSGDEDIMIPVPLSDAYLHHHVVDSEEKFHDKHILKSGHSHGVGFGAGTESRGTRQTFPYPYRFTTVEGEDELIANVHVINTRGMSSEDAHQCLECPCTAEDIPFMEKRKSHWRNDTCSSALMEEENDSCFPEKYRGGIRCCEHGEFCLDKFFMSKEDKMSLQSGKNSSNSTALQSVFYLRYIIAYTPATPDIQPLYLAACCDASGDETHRGNVEYDIPKCNNTNSGNKIKDSEADGDDCIHELDTVQSLHGEATGTFGLGGAKNEEDTFVDIVYMVGHLHRGGISMSSYFMNGTELCISLPTYGSGLPHEIGNEPGYINSMSSCTFDPPLRMKTTDNIRVVGRYNSSEAHTGVMSLFYIALADVAVPKPGEQGSGTGIWKYFHSLAGGVALVCIVIVAIHYYPVLSKKIDRRRGYESVPSSNVELSV